MRIERAHKNLGFALKMTSFALISPLFARLYRMEAEDSGYATPTNQGLDEPLGPPPRPAREININGTSTPSHQRIQNQNDTPFRPPGARIKRHEKLTILTWNVWFDEYCQTDRNAHIVSSILSLSPDVACFQEVSRPLLRALKANKELSAAYDMSTNPIYNYGILTLVRKDLANGVHIEETALPTRMRRSLLAARIPVPRAKGRSFLVGNVHLESLDNEPLRRRQLAAAGRSLSGEEAAASVLVGDFNFDSRQTWGDWKRAAPSRAPAQLENGVLAEVMPEWVDAWPHLRGTGEGVDPGITFDGATNPVCVRDKDEQMRYDRVMVRKVPKENHRDGAALALVLNSIDMVGTEEIDGTGLKASDHYGLLVTLDII